MCVFFRLYAHAYKHTSSQTRATGSQTQIKFPSVSHTRWAARFRPNRCLSGLWSSVQIGIEEALYFPGISSNLLPKIVIHHHGNWDQPTRSRTELASCRELPNWCVPCHLNEATINLPSIELHPVPTPSNSVARPRQYTKTPSRLGCRKMAEKSTTPLKELIPPQTD